MAGRRRKRRTHVKGGSGGEVEGKQGVPKSFVVRIGPADKSLTQLVRDFRRVMEPLTASRLQERRGNRLRDYQAVAGPLGVTHFCLFGQSSGEEGSVNVRVGVFPGGPTLQYRVQGYCLMRDVAESLRRPHSPGTEFLTSPLVVLSGFDVQRDGDRVESAVLRNAFPGLVPSRTKLGDVRRVVLFSRAEGVVRMRHYLISVRGEGSGLERKLRKASDVDLSKYADIADYFIQAADTSESEADNSVVVANQTKSSQRKNSNENKSSSSGNKKDANQKSNVSEEKKKIRLIELGPRLDLTLIKITEGLNGGKVFYHI